MRIRELFAGLAVGAMSVMLFANRAAAQSSTETYQYDALGRLISVITSGGQNNNETHTICYDDAGNRTDYVSDGSGARASCAAPTSPPNNNPPTTQSDWAGTGCASAITANVTANDSDPDGDPLTVTSIAKNYGAASSATIVSASSVSLTGASFPDSSSYAYTTSDSNGGIATGTLTVDTFCGF